MIELTTFLTSLPNHPGVYQMWDAQQQTIYVGKARNLKKRVTSYFRANIPDAKTQLLVKQIADITFTVTETETEALLLECNLIKELKPRYNILLRDDKSYPYLYINSDHEFPRMDLVRGRMSKTGHCFGPYPNTYAARSSLRLMQKTFLLRQCRDSFFKGRSRPCLQYQIKRCTAPCVGFVDKAAYQQDVARAILFLEGKENQVIDDLTLKMDQAAIAQDYEQAAHFRDQIAHLRVMQTEQYITGSSGNDDVIVILIEQGVVCVELLSIREGHLLGSRSYFPKVTLQDDAETVLMAFIGQHYLVQEEKQRIPKAIITNIKLTEKNLMEEALTQQANKQVRIQCSGRGSRLRWLEMATRNAQTAILQRLKSEALMMSRLNALQSDLELGAQPMRIECFDVSHTQGEATIVSCVVWGPQGAIKSDYRRFNVKGITPGDDYAALQQGLMRRYTRVKTSEGALPDMVIIDGGKGQLSVAKQVLEELQLTDIILLSMAKGPERKSGEETIWRLGLQGIHTIEVSTLGRHLLESIRDEAHRFAIMAHRKKQRAARLESALELIPGLGKLRRRALLRYFGGWQEVMNASVKMLASVPGISQALAQRIYDSLHE